MQRRSLWMLCTGLLLAVLVGCPLAAAAKASSPNTFVDYYEMLHLVALDHTTNPPKQAPSVTLEEVKKAFLQRAKVLHPDKRTDVSAEEANAQFRVLVQARQTLLDADFRPIYDGKYVIFCAHRRVELAEAVRATAAHDAARRVAFVEHFDPPPFDFESARAYFRKILREEQEAEKQQEHEESSSSD